jgi:hypothetical protein
MAVKFTKPEINVREKLAELDKPSGIAGEAMLRAETVAEQQALIGLGRRNLLINGDFQVSQRGDFTSTTSANNNDFKMDRWQIRVDTVAAQVRQNSSVTLPNGDVTFSHYVVANSTGTGYHNIRQIIEDYRFLSGKTITLSCWVKGLGQPVFFRHWSTANIGDPIYLTNRWQYVTRTYVCPTITAAGEGANQTSFGIGTYNGTVSIQDGDNFEVAEFQLERGKVATPFEHRSFGEELALCQRYYEKIEYDTSTDSGGGAANETLIANGFAYTTTRSLNHIKFNVIKRSQPTVTIVGGVAKMEVLDTTGGWVTTTAFTARANIHGTRLDLTHPSSLTAGNALEVRILSGGYLNIDAEI